MQIHQLRYFCAVARTGSFTRAAQQQHMAQPSLSQQVRKLEDELGTRLFDRLGRTVRLTQLGEMFLSRAEAILRQVDSARLEIQDMAGTEQGKLVVGAIPTIAPYFLPRCLASFASKFPRARIHIVEDFTNELVSLIHRGSVDVALLALPVPASQGLCHDLFRERLYAVVPCKHRLAACSYVRLAQIEDEPFLLLKEGHCFRENTLSLCARARVRPNVVFESGQFATILAMVGAGSGVSIVPQMAVEERQDCRFIPLSDEGAYRRVGVLQLKHHFRSRVHRAFLKHLRETQMSHGVPLQSSPVAA
jgi:LysR family transcriptional regulator, hydrogen peroxide-inducible genes activator